MGNITNTRSAVFYVDQEHKAASLEVNKKEAAASYRAKGVETVKPKKSKSFFSFGKKKDIKEKSFSLNPLGKKYAILENPAYAKKTETPEILQKKAKLKDFFENLKKVKPAVTKNTLPASFEVSTDAAKKIELSAFWNALKAPNQTDNASEKSNDSQLPIAVKNSLQFKIFKARVSIVHEGKMAAIQNYLREAIKSSEADPIQKIATINDAYGRSYAKTFDRYFKDAYFSSFDQIENNVEHAFSFLLPAHQKAQAEVLQDFRDSQDPDYQTYAYMLSFDLTTSAEILLPPDKLNDIENALNDIDIDGNQSALNAKSTSTRIERESEVKEAPARKKSKGKLARIQRFFGK